MHLLKHQDSASTNRHIVRMIACAALSLLAILWLLPVAWVAVNSFRTNSEFITAYTGFRSPLEYLQKVLPREWTLGSYIQLFTGEGVNAASNMSHMLKNSLIVSIVQTLVVLFVTSLSAFAYERLHFPNGEKIFWTLFCLSLFPNAVTIIPLFKICFALNWVNDINALIWPGCVGVMNIFLLRNFMKSIPKEMDEAARIDGASSFAVYRHVVMPCMTPALMVVGLFAFQRAWNDYLWPCIVMTGSANQTLTAGLRLLQNQYGGSYWATLLAATMLSMLVPFVIYLCAQKYFLEGISIQEAVKG